MDDERHRNLGDARAQAFDEGGHGAATAVAGVTRVVVLAATGALQDPVHLPAQTIERGARLAARGEGAFDIDARGARKSVGWGKSVVVRVTLGGGVVITKKVQYVCQM